MRELLGSAGSVMRYDAASARYVYNLSTKGLTAREYLFQITGASVATPDAVVTVPK
jgi:hypothetical protein